MFWCHFQLIKRPVGGKVFGVKPPFVVCLVTGHVTGKRPVVTRQETLARCDQFELAESEGLE